MFKKYKIIIILVLAGAVITGLYTYDRWRYNAGYEAGKGKQVLACQTASLAALESDLSEARQDLSDAITEAEKRRKRALELATELQKQESQSNGYQKRIQELESDEDITCRSIDPKYYELQHGILSQKP